MNGEGNGEEQQGHQEGESSMATKYCMAGFKLMYNGLPSEDFDEFCRQFDAHATLANFTPDKQKLSFQTRLSGNALVFFNTLTTEEKATLITIKQALKQNFEGDSWKWQLETRLLSRKQLSGECVDDYAADIIKMSTQLQKGNTDQISYFVRGLLPSIRAFVFSKEPKTLKEAIESARLGVVVDNTAKELEVPSSAPTPAVVTSVQEEDKFVKLCDRMSNKVTEGILSGLADRNVNVLSSHRANQVNPNSGTRYNDSRRNQHYYANSPSYNAPAGTYSDQYTQNSQYRSRQIECYRCGKKGHIRQFCRSKWHKQGYPLN